MAENKGVLTPAGEQPATEDEMDTILARIKRAREAAASPVDMEQFDQAEQEAKQMYQDRASRNEWLSLADRVGNAITRIGAAQAGLKHGVDLSNINYGPMKDWDKDTDRAFQDYTTELGRQGSKRSAALKNRENEMGLGEKAFEYDWKSKEQAARDARAAEEEKAKDKRYRDSLMSQEARSDARLKRQEEAELSREERENKRLELKDLEGKEAAALRQNQARQALFNQLQQANDLSGKSKDKLEQQYGKLAAEAGVDLGEIQARLEEQETRPRIFGGRSKEEDQKAKSQILNEKLAESKNLLADIQRRKQERLTGSQPQVRGEEVPAAKEPSAEMVAKYVKLNPSVTEAQARDILKKRLNAQ